MENEFQNRSSFAILKAKLTCYQYCILVLKIWETKCWELFYIVLAYLNLFRPRLRFWQYRYSVFQWHHHWPYPCLSAVSGFSDIKEETSQWRWSVHPTPVHNNPSLPLFCPITNINATFWIYITLQSYTARQQKCENQILKKVLKIILEQGWIISTFHKSMDFHQCRLMCI